MFFVCSQENHPEYIYNDKKVIVDSRGIVTRKGLFRNIRYVTVTNRFNLTPSYFIEFEEDVNFDMKRL